MIKGLDAVIFNLYPILSTDTVGSLNLSSMNDRFLLTICCFMGIKGTKKPVAFLQLASIG